MIRRLLYLLCLCSTVISFPLQSFGQAIKYAKIIDAATKEPVPFATIKYGLNGYGIIADLNGRFEIPKEVNSIEVSSMGYQTKNVDLPLNNEIIRLLPDAKALQEIIVKPPTEKIRRIINNAIANKPNNNPDKYEQYRCSVYYKMVVDVVLHDTSKKDTSADTRELLHFLDNNHLLMNETFSKRTWKKPQRLQEDVIATRFSGLKKSAFTSLVTDVLPFHAYTDYLTLNGKDYHNPVSRGHEQYYRFGLVNEILQGTDTIWTLSFKPKGNNANDLAGTVNISSNKYAITHIIARANDTMLRLNVRIEQEYTLLHADNNSTKWFPKHLNYIIDWQLQGNKTPTTMRMCGNSLIDSVSWVVDDNFKFDKTHTVRLKDRADQLNDTTWNQIRPIALNAKEASTYHVIDSIGAEFKFDKYMSYLTKLPEGKIPVGIWDFDIARLFSYNAFEKVRLGMGIQTNEHLVKWLSLGGWAGYGFGDTHWKYGAFAEIYAGKYRDFKLTAGYTDDITDPGRLNISPDLDKNYLKSYLLQRVDKTQTWYVNAKWRKNYWTFTLGGMQQQIMPQYKYALRYNNAELKTFEVQEGSLSWRYAYAERTAPIFGSYYSIGSKYPIVYGRVIAGKLNSNSLQSTYYQAVMAIAWHKHFNRIGYEHILVEGGKSWSDKSLPLSKLFAGNGFKYNSESNLSLYTFGGMMTIYPYDFYSDQFINVVYRHDFDWKLYKLETNGSSLSSAPNICLQYNMLYGGLSNAYEHELVTFKTPQNPYNEAGMLLNNLVRLRYLNLYYLTFNMGYFYHIEDLKANYNAKNGRFVFGLGIEF